MPLIRNLNSNSLRAEAQCMTNRSFQRVPDSHSTSFRCIVTFHSTRILRNSYPSASIKKIWTTGLLQVVQNDMPCRGLPSYPKTGKAMAQNLWWPQPRQWRACSLWQCQRSTSKTHRLQANNPNSLALAHSALSQSQSKRNYPSNSSESHQNNSLTHI